jgi:serine/threonine protein kinase/tetratricopeptide (TPR) repeat protein
MHQEFRHGERSFEVKRELGSGAFGVVYEVFDRERQTTLALKALERLDPANVVRFKQEFRALADLDHPNLVTYYELFAQDDGWFFTMELVPGRDFVSHVRGGAPPSASASNGSLTHTAQPHLDQTVALPDTATRSSAGDPSPSALVRVSWAWNLAPGAVDWGRLRDATSQLAGAVRALHAAGKLHRDIKPSNVLVTEEGRVVVLDFGLVAPITGDGVTDVAGTPLFMAPELVYGRVTPAADWYAIGVVLYLVIAGRPPFEGTFAEMLRAKLHTPPPPLPAGTPDDIAALCLDLLRPDPGKRPGGDEVLARLGADVQPPAPASQPFVGRARDLAVLEDAFDAAGRGQAAAVLLSGRSGNGKSALARRFLRGAARRSPGAVVCEGRCYEREFVPYKALDTAMDALFSHVASLPPAEVEALLPSHAHAISRIFPAAAQVEAIRRAPAAEGLEEAELRARAFRALRDLVAAIAGRGPLVLFVDDLHWGDRESAIFLSDLLSPPDPPPILLVAAYRSEERAASAALEVLLPALRRALPEDRLHELHVGELDPEDARALTRALVARAGAGDEQEIAHVAREAGGNPFFIGELAEHVRERRPLPAPADGAEDHARLDDAVAARVRRLPEASRVLVDLVAVAGRRVPARVIARAARLGTGRRLDEVTMGRLRRARLLRTADVKGEPWVDTYHDRIREAVTAGLPADVQRDLHARLARAWEEAGGAEPETLAWHHEQAGAIEPAHRHMVAAARRAADALAFEHAAILYRRAAALARRAGAPTREIEAALAAALASSGRRAEAAEVYLSLARTAPAGEVVALRCAAAEQLVRSGRVDEGHAVFVEIVEAEGMRWPATRALALARVALAQARIRLRGTRYEERREADVPPDLLRRVDVLGAITRGLHATDPIVTVIFHARLMMLALEAGEPRRIVRALVEESGASAFAGTRRGPRADRIADQAEAIAERLGDVRLLADVTLLRGLLAFMSGDWRAARAHAERGEAMLEQGGGAGSEYDRSTFALHAALFHLGEIGALDARARAQTESAERRGDRFVAVDLCTAQAATARLFRTGDPVAVRDEIERALAGWSSRGFVQRYGGWLNVIETLIYEARGREAHERCLSGWDELRRLMVLTVQFTAITSHYLRARAALAAAAERADPAPLLRDALGSAEALERQGAPWGAALARIVRGGAASVEGAATRAAVILAEGERAAEACGMALHAAAARHARGAILGGEHGAALCAGADDRMRALGAAEPARVAWCLAPGSWRKAGRIG